MDERHLQVNRGGRGTGRGNTWGRRGSNGPDSNYSHTRQSNQYEKKARLPLTHFLALPLGHIPAVQETVSGLTSALLKTTPAIPGLDDSIVIFPRRLHFTLAVMSLKDDNDDTPSNGSKTVSDAISLLESIRPEIIQLLRGRSLRVPLSAIDIMKPERNDLTRAHVLFAGPSEADLMSSDGKLLISVAETIRQAFNQAGLNEDRRELKLHCTLLNTKDRKSESREKRNYVKRIPFSFKDIRESAVIQKCINKVNTSTAFSEDNTSLQKSSAPLNPSSSSSTNSNTDTRRERSSKTALSLDLGTYDISEIQICRMGSRGPEGEYVCVGRINI